MARLEFVDKKDQTLKLSRGETEFLIGQLKNLLDGKTASTPLLSVSLYGEFSHELKFRVEEFDTGRLVKGERK